MFAFVSSASVQLDRILDRVARHAAVDLSGELDFALREAFASLAREAGEPRPVDLDERGGKTHL